MISTHWRTPHAPTENDFRLFDVLVRQAADLIDRTQADAALSTVSQRLIEAQENERAHIARELHDDVGQRLALVINGLDALARANRMPTAAGMTAFITDPSGRTARAGRTKPALSIAVGSRQ